MRQNRRGQIDKDRGVKNDLGFEKVSDIWGEHFMVVLWGFALFWKTKNSWQAFASLLLLHSLSILQWFKTVYIFHVYLLKKTVYIFQLVAKAEFLIFIFFNLMY